MKRLLPLLLLVACGPSDEAAQAKVFEPFPNADGYDFGCTYALADGEAPVFGTDAAAPEQAFAYFGKETLRLTALDEDGLYQAYDYPDFQLRVGEGTLTMLRRQGTDYQPMGESVPVTRSCKG